MPRSPFDRLSVAASIFGVAVFTAITLSQAEDRTYRDDLSEQDRLRVSEVTAPATSFDKGEKFEARSGGAGTSTASVDANAFSHSSENLDFEAEQDFKVGNGLFRKLWVSAPSSTQASDGLGPLFNARSCQRCHLKDGRGHTPNGPDDSRVSMFLRLSVPPQSNAQRKALEEGLIHRVPEPTYGGQLQDQATPGVVAEGQMQIAYEEIEVTLHGEETAYLRKPAYSVSDLGYGPMHPDTMMSPRVAPPMIGLGLLEAVHPDDILARHDPDDADGDGISGRVSWVRDPIGGGKTIGRFGWKANAPSILLQSAHAFSGDIGMSSPISPNPDGDCTTAQNACLNAPNGVQSRLGDTELPDPILGLVAHYSANLAVPLRRNVDDPAVLKGKQLFYEAGCAACHTPKYVTSRDAERQEHRFQLIWPYTDMLLHDMGEGLSDSRPLANAEGREWRTPPLWGIGLTGTVNGHTFFLHDGRARSLLEAILWHGGEAETARNSVVGMMPEERAALLRFLGSL